MSKEQFIIAMRFLASSVSVISAKDQSGKLYSMTASSVTSLTIDPPSVLVCCIVVDRSCVPEYIGRLCVLL